MRSLIASLLALLVLASPTSAASKKYFAERFDSRIRALDGGAIEVVETVVFRFEGGPFKEVFREIPRRRTDGIEIVGAAMDGRQLAIGGGQGQVQVRQGKGNKVRVVWRFAPRSDSTNAFELTYIVRGVVYREGGRDVLAWTALPREHNYSIARSEVIFDLPSAPAEPPTISTRRVGQLTDPALEPGGRRVHLIGTDIRKDGSLTATMKFDEGALIAAAPNWQARQLAARDLAPRWLTAAAVVFVAGLLLLFGLYQRYDSPRGLGGSSPPVAGAPDGLRAGVAGVLAGNGSVSLSHAMATLFSLADRGIVTIVEEPRRWGQRNFTLRRRAHDISTLAPEESIILTHAFRHKDRDEDSVPLDQARRRIMARIADFKRAAHSELRTLGLLDDERIGVRRRLLRASVALLVVAGLLVIPAAIATRTYLGWPFLIPAAVAAVAIIGFIIYGSLTPLSNEGVRRAESWRAYRNHLKEVARDRAQLAAETPQRVLPFAVALGLAGLWSKYMKHHPTGIPNWFSALSVSDQEGFPSFLAVVHAADGSAHAGGVGGGAAGGGASGAS
jgi:hypothetical protein